MALPLTDVAKQLLQKTEITPQIVLEIDGVPTLYGAVEIKKIWKVGDPGLLIGQPGLFIGGQVAIGDQESLISWTGGTSSSIKQTLNVDKATNESISTINIALLDKSLKATKLITPGEVVPEILGKKVLLWLGEADGSWKDDYNIIFRGFISDIEAKSGIVTLKIASPDALKKGTTFLAGETELNGSINDTDTTLTVLDTSDFLTPFTNPGGGIDTSLKLYVRIDDEIMRYEATTGTTFGTVTRGELGTIAVAHTDESVIASFYRITGTAIDLALKLMLSGQSGPYLDAFEVSSFQSIPSVGTVPNAIFLADFDLPREQNIQVGDFVTTTGATNPANDVTNRLITEVTATDVGYYIIVDGAALVTEGTTSATVDISSKYDTWGPDAGLGMTPGEVDIDEHLNINTKFLSSAQYDFYLKEEIEDGKEFISEQIYNPASAYAIPRKAQASIGYNIGPIPGSLIKTLDATNVKDASRLSMTRSTSKRMFNTIIYKFDEDPLEEKFLRGTVFIDGTSVAEIPIGNKKLTIESKGLRQILSAFNTAQIASTRRLKRYRRGAESIRRIQTNFSTGFDIEIGDKVIVNMADLQLTDIKSGTRSGEPRLFEAVNKDLNIRTGNVTFDLLDTNFDLDVRYCLVSASSFIKTGTSTTEFIIDPSFNTSRFGTAEWRKWERFTGTEVIVRSPDYTVSGTANLIKVTSNTITVDASLGFTPLAGYVMECGDYDNQSEDVKLVYCSMSDGDNDFADGKVSYKMS